jgi:DNA-binding response OmpR family regulator
VILVTAKSRDEDVLSGYKEGADYYITKPFSAQQLLYGVRLVLGLGGSAHTRAVDPTSTSHH